MSNYNEIIEIIKKAATDAVKASKPVTICYGVVDSTSPLKIKIDSKLTLGSSQLILSRNVTDYTTTMTIESGNVQVTIKNAIKTGDNVVLCRIQGGNKYVVIDKVGDAT